MPKSSFYAIMVAIVTFCVAIIFVSFHWEYAENTDGVNLLLYAAALFIVAKMARLYATSRKDI